MIVVVLITAAALLLAWANGANDVSRGVATIAGSGLARTRHAVLWGTVCTALGGLAALAWGAALLGAFTTGYLAPEFPVSPAFVGGAVSGAAAWILLATRLGLPVSTTHALLGGIVGAALAAGGSGAVHATAVAGLAVVPLLISPVIALTLAWLLLRALRRVGRLLPAWTPDCCPREEWQRDPFTCSSCGVPRLFGAQAMRFWNGLHWASAGATSFARGLNDVPKIAALLVLAATLPGNPLPSGPAAAILAVTVAMTLGGLWGGFRVLRVLAHRIVPLDAVSGLTANLGTSLLVLAASPLGLPVSTTHVSTGSLMGLRAADRKRPGRHDALRLVLFGWVITFPVAAACAATGCWLFGGP